MKRVLLIGNGFDIQFNSDFSLENLISKIVKPYYVINFKRICNFLIKRGKEFTISELLKLTTKIFDYKSDEDALETIDRIFKLSATNTLVINNSDASLEDLFTEFQFKLREWIDILVEDYDGPRANEMKEVAMLKKSFCEMTKIALIEYLASLEEAMRKKLIYKRKFLYEQWRIKLVNYNHFLTTNYTSTIQFLLWKLGRLNVGNLTTLHGSFYQERLQSMISGEQIKINYNNLLLADENGDKDENILYEGIAELRDWLQSAEIKNQLCLDIFGLSIQNDDKTMYEILKSLEYVKEESKKWRETSVIIVNYFYYSEFDRQQFIDYLATNREMFKEIKFNLKSYKTFFSMYNDKKG